MTTRTKDEAIEECRSAQIRALDNEYVVHPIEITDNIEARFFYGKDDGSDLSEFNRAFVAPKPVYPADTIGHPWDNDDCKNENVIMRLVKIGNGKYFCRLSSGLGCLSFDNFAPIIQNNPRLEQAYSKVCASIATGDCQKCPLYNTDCTGVENCRVRIQKHFMEATND